jgi:LuxR family maltose regulon positive regulatory protein
MDDLARAPLTVVVAPAGSGKTTLVTDWASTSAVRTVWLSLDAADRGGLAFWSAVLGALGAEVPGPCVGALELARRRAPLADVVAELLDDLGDVSSDPLVLVVDDFHLVDDDDEVASSVAAFAEHLPAWLHVVLVSRREPGLPLDRLRARGQLGEIRFRELSFSMHEACAMLAALAPRLAPEELEAAAQHADGWAAGLQLAGLAARSAQARPTSSSPPMGDDSLVEHYVWHEVLANEPEELVELLLDVAVVDRLGPGLARALAGRDDAGDLVRRAEERGLFISRLGAGEWVAIHPLVRSSLVAHLSSRSPERLAQQHALAAAWLQDAGAIESAVGHWQRAGRPRDALRLLAGQVAGLYDTGRETVISRALESIPSEAAYEDLEAMIEYTWCHLLVSRTRFVELVAQSSWWAERTPLDSPAQARLRILQSIAALMTGELDRCGTLAHQAIEALGDEWWRDSLGRFGWNMVVRDVALSERWDDGLDEVREAELALSRDPNRRLAFEGTRALGEALAGRPLSALRSVAGMWQSTSLSNLVIFRSELALAEAIAHRELGDRERAVPELTALARTRVEPMSYVQARAMCELVQAHLDEGAVAEAERWLSEATTLIDTEFSGPAGALWLSRAGTTLCVATGAFDDARQWNSRTEDPVWHAIGATRVLLADGEIDDAAAALVGVEPRNVREEIIIELLGARTIADHTESLKHVYVAIERATAHGVLQTVASEGPAALELVERAAWRAPSPWLDRLRRLAPAVRGRPRDTSHSPDALTERERDVLRFLPSRLTLPEIANELYVSVNTLKFHLKVIYRKLDVTCRAEAAEVARRMMSTG